MEIHEYTSGCDGNGGFPPIWWLGDRLPEAGRKMGACGGKCNTEWNGNTEETHGMIPYSIMLNNVSNNDDHQYS